VVTGRKNPASVSIGVAKWHVHFITNNYGSFHGDFNG